MNGQPQLTIGYSPYNSPSDGVGPFRELYKTGVNLAHVDSLKGIDAVVLWGGADISPTLYAEEPIIYSGPKVPTQRDLFELEICRQAYAEGKPLIGVCRGAQFLCSFAGGKLVQDVTGHNSDHHITTEDGKGFMVTSSHHQMLFPFDVEHEMLAWSTNHLSKEYRGCSGGYMLKDKHYAEPEVVYFPEINALACQCHPEWHRQGDVFNKWLMEQIKVKLLGETLESA